MKKGKGSDYNCICPTNSTGPNCNITIIFIDSSDCPGGKLCYVDDLGTPTNCTCPESVCTNNPCENGGTCQLKSRCGKYNCICNVGYSGENCSTTNPCSSNPCLNGAACNIDGKFIRKEKNYKKILIKVIKGLGGPFNCTCKSGYSGESCQITPCTINPCKNGGACLVNGLGKNK